MSKDDSTSRTAIQRGRRAFIRGAGLASLLASAGCLRLVEQDTQTETPPATPTETATEQQTNTETATEQQTNTETATEQQTDTESDRLIQGPVTDRWTFEANAPVMVSPVVVDGTVYFGDNFNSYAVDASDGSMQWRFEYSPLESSQVVNDGTVYFGTNETNAGTVYAVDAADGTQQWAFETDGPVRPPPAVANDTLYVGSDDQNVYALDARNGAEQWRFETDERVGAIGVENGTVYAGSDVVYALDASNGDERWQGGEFNLVAYSVDSLAVNDGTVYYAAGEKLTALNGTDGSTEWEFQMGGGTESLPTVEGGTLYVGGEQFVYAMDPSDGTGLWGFQTGPGTSSPAVAGDTVYVGDDNYNVWGVAATDGTQRWRFKMDGEATSPAVDSDTIYVGSKEGRGRHRKVDTPVSGEWQMEHERHNPTESSFVRRAIQRRGYGAVGVVRAS